MFQEYLFRAICESIECADDDSMFLSPEYKEWADNFEKWLNSQDNERYKCFKRSETNNYVIFTYDQSCIWFTDNINECPWIKWVFECYVHSSKIQDHLESFNYNPPKLSQLK